MVVDGFCNYRSWKTRIEMMGSSSLLFNAKFTYFLTITIECAALLKCLCHQSDASLARLNLRMALYFPIALGILIDGIAS